MMEQAADHVMSVMTAAFDPQFGEAWNRQQVLDALLTPNTHCLLATQRDILRLPIGLSTEEPATGFLLSRAAPGEEELLLLAVVPERRRAGIASRLINAFKTDARARRAERIFLQMRVNNPARHFYRTHGFVEIGRRRDYYRQNDGSRLDAITFGHDIAA